jgi:hypothetical protein
MSYAYGYARRGGNHGNSDCLEYLRGVLASEDHTPVYPSNVPFTDEPDDDDGPWHDELEAA